MGWASPARDHALETLRTAVGHGAELLDVADVFGHGRAERLVGRLLREVPRDQVRIAVGVGRAPGTSTHPFAGTALRRQFEQTLENLGTDHLDVYALDRLDFGPDDEHLGDCLAQMRALREDDHVRAVAMPAPDPHHRNPEAAARRFVRLFKVIRPDIVTLRHNGLCPPIRLDGEYIADFTARQGVGLIVREPLALGVLSGKYDPRRPPRFGTGDSRRGHPWFTPDTLTAIEPELSRLRARFGPDPRILVRLAVQHCLRLGEHTAVVVGATDPEQAGAHHGPGPESTDEEARFVDETYRRMRSRLADRLGHVPGPARARARGARTALR
ncbi:aldo/keto reductase (plasmid) [Embleya sp. NBC_00888]|uniref:aldo/keto reductase n=1 Tax=Embleya sp. NBC_00888 TaxID=2975960 RepID=UPI00386CFB04|nr:aldo/keto reductase [Embleya sp. NBC_00888]